MKKIIIFFAILFSMNTSKAQDYRFDPPWNTPPQSAVNFTIFGLDNLPDVYGDIVDPQLVVFFAGNQFMVIDDLLATFKKEYPQYQRIFVETLPPGILAKQIEGGSLTIGNLRIGHKPDIYTAGTNRIREMAYLFEDTIPYAQNKLAVMVPRGNPKNIRGLADLGRKDIRVAMPNPEWEGIGRLIEQAYVKAGGKSLKEKVMNTKVEDSTTFLTHIHHRQSAMRILYGKSDVAPVWVSEVLYQQKVNHPVDLIEIPDEHNVSSTYMAGLMKEAPRKKAGRDFLTFLGSESAKQIYKKYGFTIPEK